MNTSYGIELYSLRDITDCSMKLALKESAEMGYRTAEFAGFFDYNAEQIKTWLDTYGLKPIATHTGLGALDDEHIEATIAYHKAIGCSNIVVPSVPFATQEQMDASLAALSKAQKRLAAEGIALGYHNHSLEFLPTAYGKIFEEELLARTDVLLEVDTFWSFNAGVDTIAFLNAHKDRVFLLHLKDGIPTAAENQNAAHCYEGVSGKAVGEGKAPVRDVIAWATAHDVPMIVESEGLDPTGLAEVGRCMDFLKSID